MACDPETLTCVPANGFALVDDPCPNGTECMPGLVCFDDRCRELCGLDLIDEDECDGGRVCTLADAPLPGMCLEPCSLILQACSSIADACNLGFGAGAAIVAVCTSNFGAGVDGDACEIDGECLPGYLCTPASVHTLACANDAAACCAPICDVLEMPCFGVEPVCHVLGIQDQPGAGFCGI
jgi:hypothetical protein